MGRSIRFAVISVLTTIFVGLGLSCKLSSQFENIKIGDTKQTVVVRLGQPDEIRSCDLEKEGKLCKEADYFFSTFERLIVYYDELDKVMDKSYSVLP